MSSLWYVHMPGGNRSCLALASSSWPLGFNIAALIPAPKPTNMTAILIKLSHSKSNKDDKHLFVCCTQRSGQDMSGKTIESRSTMEFIVHSSATGAHHFQCRYTFPLQCGTQWWRMELESLYTTCLLLLLLLLPLPWEMTCSWLNIEYINIGPTTNHPPNSPDPGNCCHLGSWVRFVSIICII